MLVSYVAWTALNSVFVTTRNISAGQAVVAFIFIVYFFYNIARAPLLLAYLVEIFPYTLRARGVAVTFGSTFVGLIIGQFVNPIAMGAISWKYYIVFICINALLFVAIYFIFPETRGGSLEEITEIAFDGKNEGITDPKVLAEETQVENITVTSKADR